MLDAAALEKKGIHTVTIVWETFARAARMAARAQRIPDAKMVIIPYRKGDDDAAEQRAKARAATPEIVKLLLES